jgi:uncharacterized OB-fold protein
VNQWQPGTGEAGEMSPVAPGLFSQSGGDLHLIGARRKSDGRVVFPMPEGSEADKYEAVKLANQGLLWSFTIQRFRPKSPPYAAADDECSFKPFALGYVELPGQIIVESRIVCDDVAELKIGMKMRMELVPFALADGRTVSNFAFRPVRGDPQ